MPLPRPKTWPSPSLSLTLLLLLLCVLWLAGGASRADALGQVVVRACSWAALVAAVLFSRRLSWVGIKPVLVITLAALAITLLQLVPLPPAIWTALSGRTPFIEASAATGQGLPWRPWSIVPGGTLNAAFSLIVPLTVLLLLAGLRENERPLLPGALLAVVTASAVLGLLQFSGTIINNPLINETIGEVSGSFANRNHFALFLAWGCLLAPVWAVDGRRGLGWRGLVAVGLLLLFALTILASGSRMGLLLGAVALLVGTVLVAGDVRRSLTRAPRWVAHILMPGVLGAVLIAVCVSIAAGRAVSINRAFAVDPGQDMRGRGFSTVIDMIRTYWPAGSGSGSFDQMFRFHEPFDLLKPTFFNHAHNDYLEILLTTGAAGLLLLGMALGWWAWASVRAWQSTIARTATLARLGSAMLLLVAVASIFDYPARTPMIMTFMVVAGSWLAAGVARPHGSALPRKGPHL